MIVGLPISPHILLVLLVLLEALAVVFKLLHILQAGFYVHWVQIMVEVLRFVSLEGLFICCCILCFQSGGKIKPLSESLQVYTMVFVSVGVLIEYLAFSIGIIYLCYTKVKELVNKKKSESYIFYRKKHTINGKKKSSRTKQRENSIGDEQTPHPREFIKKNPDESCMLQLNISYNFQNENTPKKQRLKFKNKAVSSRSRRQKTNKKSKRERKSIQKEIDEIDVEEFEKRNNNQSEMSNCLAGDKSEKSQDKSEKNHVHVHPRQRRRNKKPQKNQSPLKYFFGEKKRRRKNTKNPKAKKGKSKDKSLSQNQSFIPEDNFSSIRSDKESNQNSILF